MMETEPIQRVIPALGETSRTEIVEFEHKQLLDIGKFFYDGLFKFASMSFLLNGVLLSALAFVVKDVGSSSHTLLAKAIFLLGAIGIVYNCGVACACISLAITAWHLSARFDLVDKELGLHIADCKSASANFWGTIGWSFTAIFFILWIGVWGFLIANRTVLLHNNITQNNAPSNHENQIQK